MRCLYYASAVAAESNPHAPSLFGNYKITRRDPSERNVQWVFLGSPGVGKGTYANRLSTLLGIPHISTGDLVREELASSGPIAKQLTEIVNQGKLVSDEIIISLLSKILQAGEASESGFILDGFPRTINQAEILEGVTDIDLVGQTGCPGISMAPLLPPSNCMSKLVTRSDDTEKVVKQRLWIYNEKSQPLEDYYRNQGKLMEFDLPGGIPESWPKLLEALNLDDFDERQAGSYENQAPIAGLRDSSDRKTNFGVKEAERIVIAKPVASRPTCSSFKSFSELLAGAINVSPPNVCSENIVPAIRPKTVRFKPVVNRAPFATVSSQAEQSGIGMSISSDKVLKSDLKRTTVYKPQAKLVSKTTVSILANMGNFGASNELTLQSMEVTARPDLHNTSSHTETDQTSEPLKVGSQNMDEDPKVLPAVANSDRPSYDGYNWRKYGQKQVKGSEYPRSYYKCTHPNCPVKKKVERSLDGQIAEIVYKGEHNHSKPQPVKRNSPQGVGFSSDGTSSERRVENHNEVGLSIPPAYQGKALLSYEHVTTGAVNAGGTSETSVGLSGECEEGNKDGADGESRSKRRRNENQSSEVGTLGECIQEPRVVVQSSTDSEIIGDGFRWRKYGQKVVKGNPYPRSYYRCTNLKCNVRKHVERASDDPRAFISTYEGKHNHEMPLRNTNHAASSDPDSSSPVIKDKR
ncbi:Adenylate kinase 1 [Hibiscus syriacus]|uniref:adenylate kinase n=1 Tax=Hibiscus syriacus TaxID=106335 RepID=A0A6A2WM35_HIBSY|nr:Adenylate kinase 1 [Hibiscus syriacus]